jgi:hypothetical protein
MLVSRRRKYQDAQPFTNGSRAREFFARALIAGLIGALQRLAAPSR